MSRDADEAWGAVLTFTGRTVPLAVAARRVVALDAAIDTAREELARDMRRQGWTWREVGEAFGVTYQAARERFRARGIS